MAGTTAECVANVSAGPAFATGEATLTVSPLELASAVVGGDPVELDRAAAGGVSVGVGQTERGYDSPRFAASSRMVI